MPTDLTFERVPCGATQSAGRVEKLPKAPAKRATGLTADASGKRLLVSLGFIRFRDGQVLTCRTGALDRVG